jgi:hypothetical protein
MLAHGIDVPAVCVWLARLQYGPRAPDEVSQPTSAQLTLGGDQVGISQH